MAGEMEDLRAIIRRDASTSLPPIHVVHDLLSLGVCARCIFRLFGVQGNSYSCSVLTDSTLLSVIEELKSCDNVPDENDSNSKAFIASHISQDKEKEQTYCSICLGILQFSYDHGEEGSTYSKDSVCLDEFSAVIAELVQKAGHQIDGFSLEISIPPVILANERAFWLYMNKKYGCEDWFKETLHNENISVKDALKSSIATSLQSKWSSKFGISSFRIRLTYAHLSASVKLQSLLANNMGCRKRKIDFQNGNDVQDSHFGRRKECNEHQKSESDAVIRKTLEGLQDDVFSERFAVPPEKVNQPCHLTTLCYRMPVYIGGRYLKFSRRVSQSRWIIDDERMGEASVEEIIGSSALVACRGDSYKFHAAGREDIDVRMLGSGRPFLVEVSNARSRPSSINIQEIADAINNSREKYVSVRNLKVLGSEAWDLMREGESEKQKQYAALVWISHPLTEEDLEKMCSAKDLEISQRTPIRVLHRRSPLERKRVIHWMRIEKITGSCQYFLLHLCTQAGTYIKEFVQGDLGRTHPSIGSMLGCRAEILQLDVTDVKMDCFD